MIIVVSLAFVFCIGLSGLTGCSGSGSGNESLSEPAGASPANCTLDMRISYDSNGAIERYYAYMHDANGNGIRSVYYTGSGPDGTWFNDDDEISFYYAYTYDANGYRTRYVYYTGSGPDGIWFNDDDIIQYEYRTVYQDGQCE